MENRLESKGGGERLIINSERNIRSDGWKTTQEE